MSNFSQLYKSASRKPFDLTKIFPENMYQMSPDPTTKGRRSSGLKSSGKKSGVKAEPVGVEPSS